MRYGVILDTRGPYASTESLIAAGRAPETLRVSVQLNGRLGAPDAPPHELAGADDAVRAHLAALERLGVSELARDVTAGSRAPQGLAMMERFAALAGLRPRR